jgi:hypothetical protein
MKLILGLSRCLSLWLVISGLGCSKTDPSTPANQITVKGKTITEEITLPPVPPTQKNEVQK